MYLYYLYSDNIPLQHKCYGGSEEDYFDNVHRPLYLFGRDIMFPVFLFPLLSYTIYLGVSYYYYYACIYYYTTRDCLRVSVMLLYCMCLRSPRPSRCLLRNNDFERSCGVDDPVFDKLQAVPLEIRVLRVDCCVSREPTIGPEHFNCTRVPL